MLGEDLDLELVMVVQLNVVVRLGVVRLDAAQIVQSHGAVCRRRGPMGDNVSQPRLEMRGCRRSTKYRRA